MKMTRNAHRSIFFQNTVFYILLLTVLGLLAFFSREFNFQSDWTYGNRNSLSEPTQQLLETLEEPLKFVAYIPDNPALQEQMRKLVGKYQRVRPDIRLEMVNPDLDPVRARQDGIQYAGQMSLQLGGRSEVVDSSSEPVIANAILRLGRGNERLVVFLEGHGERNPLAEESTGLSQLVSTLERSGFRIQPHNLVRAQSVPQNARFLVIASPQKDLLPGEVDVIRRYVEQGGNLLWLQDPGDLHGLQPLADVLGVRIGGGTVLDANEQLHALLGVDHPAVVPVVDYGRSPLAANLTGSQSLFPFATQVVPHPADGGGALVWKADEFLDTLPNSWLEAGDIEGAVTYDDTQGDLLGPVSIGLSLTRLLDQPDQEGAESVAGDSPAPNPEGERQQRVVVVGDSDFLLNSFIGKGVNLDLATHIFNWLSADDNLLKVRAIGAPDTTLDMSETGSVLLAVFFLFGLPLMLVLAGVLIWLRRRRR